MDLILIDDNESLRRALAENLREDGYTVLEYGHPTEVPPLSGLGDVVAVITDFDMPGGNGLVFADRFHSAHPTVPIILLTAHRNGDLARLVASRGFVHLLHKPFDYNALCHLLGAVISQRYRTAAASR